MIMIAKFKQPNKRIKSFTLIELLIVIAILAILAAAVVIVLNPSEMISESRDSARITGLKSIDKAVSLYTINLPGNSIGSSNTVYLSLPDSSSTCASYTLPPLTSPWVYSCSTAANYQKTDGTGWIPINFNTAPGGSPFSNLPIDPINSATNLQYFAYIPSSNKWEVSGKMESEKFNVLGGNDVVTGDGGDEPIRLELGSDLTLAPWSFEFSSFPVATSRNNAGGWYYINGSATISLGSDSQASNYASFNGQGWYEWQENIPFNPNATYKLTCRYRQVTDPSSGGKGFYCGWSGVTADKYTYANASGSNDNGGQHYHASSGGTLTAGAGFSEKIGYTKGFGSPNGSSGTCPNLSSPCPVHTSVRYLRPMFIMNYANGNGIADIDYIRITKQ